MALWPGSSDAQQQEEAEGQPAEPRTRAERLQRQREEKSRNLAPYTVSRGEERVRFFETWRLPRRLFAKGFGGFRPVFGGMPSGSGLVGGGGYIAGYNSELLQFTANGRYSTRGYTAVDTGLPIFPKSNSSLPVEGHITGQLRDFTSLRYFGLGTGSSGGDRTTYRLQDQTIEAGVTTTASRFAEFGAQAQWLTAEAGAGQSGVSLDARFDPLATPGFGTETDFFVYGGSAAVHLRDAGVIPSVGVSLRVDAHRYNDRDSDTFDFTRVVGDVQAHVPIGYRNRILALRVRSSHSVGEHGGVVPFYLVETIGGANMSVPWRVFESKIGGLTPGFQIIDGRGDRYIIKVDPVGVPELSSAAEVIGTKLFYALGYNTPENYIAAVDPDKGLTIEPGTVMKDEFEDETPLTRSFLRRQLTRTPRLADGRVRVTASKYLSGRPRGPFRYYGTRSDDPNDVILHENRRELRGLRLFAAWTNHDDTRAHNTQDSYVEADGRRFVRHHLLDFGSTFGSGSVDLQLPNLSFHYWLDFDEVKKNMQSFGLHTPKYRTVDWPSFPEYDSVGRWEAEHFEPAEWRNDYPNPAFVRMTDRDAFWAAKIIMRFTPDELRAIVETGQFSDPNEEQYFLEVLIERQRRSARYYMNRLNPIDEFEVTPAGLAFANLSERYGFAETGTTYRVRWSVYDNDADSVRPLAEDAREHSSTIIPLPSAPDVREGSNLFLLAEINAIRADQPMWNRRVGIYLRPRGSTYEVVGIEREADPPDHVM